MEPTDPPSRLGRECRMKRAAAARQEAREQMGAATTEDLDHLEEFARETFEEAVAGLDHDVALVTDEPEPLEALVASEPIELDPSPRNLCVQRPLSPAQADSLLRLEAEAHAADRARREAEGTLANDPPGDETPEGEAADREGSTALPVGTNPWACPKCDRDDFLSVAARSGHQRWCTGIVEPETHQAPEGYNGPRCEVCDYTGKGTLQAVNAHRFQKHGLRGLHAQARELGNRPTSERHELTADVFQERYFTALFDAVRVNPEPKLLDRIERLLGIG
jgi:hypothetical protein